MKDHAGPICTVAISPDGRTMASAGEDGAIVLSDLGSGLPIKTMLGHAGTINSLAFNKSGSILISGGMDDTVRLWNVKEADTIEIENEAK